MTSIARVGTLAVLIVLAGCEFQRDADVKFGDQNFKTAIALIELHRTRTGSYPESLKDLEFTGDWDPIALSAVKYEKLPNGYSLDLVRGWVGKPTLTYPASFWHGLGIRKSNVREASSPSS